MSQRSRSRSNACHDGARVPTSVVLEELFRDAPSDYVADFCQLYARARVMGSYPEIVAKPNICVTEMPSNAIAVLLRSGRDQPSSWARWTFRRETGSAAYPAPPS
jgi:hypothetical protein